MPIVAIAIPRLVAHPCLRSGDMTATLPRVYGIYWRAPRALMTDQRTSSRLRRQRYGKCMSLPDHLDPVSALLSECGVLLREIKGAKGYQVSAGGHPINKCTLPRAQRRAVVPARLSCCCRDRFPGGSLAAMQALPGAEASETVRC